MSFEDIKLNRPVVEESVAVMTTAVAVINDAVQDLNNVLKQLEITWRSDDTSGSANQFAQAQFNALEHAKALKALYHKAMLTVNANADEIATTDKIAGRMFA